MAELWRVIPANGSAPTMPVTTRENLDLLRASWRRIAADRTRSTGRVCRSECAAARALVLGTVHVAANVVWIDSE